jgi:hypothetical protein
LSEGRNDGREQRQDSECSDCFKAHIPPHG